jgi:hypothetical protein
MSEKETDSSRSKQEPLKQGEHESGEVLASLWFIVHLVCTEVFKTVAPRLTVLDIPSFADAYSRTVHPIDLHNTIPRTQSVMIQLYNTTLAQSTHFPYSSVSPSRTQPGPPRHAVWVHGVQLLVC